MCQRAICTFVFRPPEKRKSVIDFRFSFFNFRNQLGKQNCIYFKFIKRPKVFRARDKRKTDFETNFVFHFQKEVTLAQTSFGTSFSDVKSGVSEVEVSNVFVMKKGLNIEELFQIDN